MTIPQTEAIEILKNLLSKFFEGKFDIISTLRACAHICRILDWKEDLNWLTSELEGYFQYSPLPGYRQDVHGKAEWIATGGIHDTLELVIAKYVSSAADSSSETEYVQLEVYGGIDWLTRAAQTGFVERTGEKSFRQKSGSQEVIEVQKIHVYDKAAFESIIQQMQHRVFLFVSRSYSILCYGDAVGDIWQQYRSVVDKSLATIGIGDKFETIRSGLNSRNPHDWRAAMYSCRDVFHDLASYLWRDPRKTYEHLVGAGPDGKLEVTDRHYVNRLGAYMHQKDITGTAGIYLRAEMERIYRSIDTLIDLASKAHAEVSYPDLRAVAIGTYTILGEMSMRTDMNPITQYANPSNSD